MAVKTASTDYEYMKLACEQARLSVPVETAYCVGCVIVSDEGKVVSTGFSRELEGNTHAEECALKKLDGKAERTTVYSTMEPCSKRLSGNRPCVEHIITTKVRRVVVGALEPANFVKCEGIQILRDAGIEVDVLQGLEEECLAPNNHILKPKAG